ncbi:glutamate racemase [Erythrobacter sp. SCSIO 43205]|uniref:glutamate racemase n=1 Tax=Erythrobacter sp. SCSIO 43205 TaxID=2779361 RepID=UPI001CA9F1AB|nr:glutamate racemase [Erythrobacter sp. SCSIO 43205]UAB76883.1 glutamate racemase [Erythrobacter sp. SCSIO 43205]
MNIPASSPILLFDSGVGGLSVFAELNRLLPKAPVIYAADLAGLPYGNKTEAQIAARVTGLLGRMAERYKPRLICIACNTASTIALGMVRDVLEVPIVGTVPAIKPAASLTKTGVIGLLGTEATIRQHYVDNLEAEFASDKKLLRLAAPELVEAAEGKLRGRPVDMKVIEDAAEKLRAMPGGDEIDTLVLACTHFPLLGRELHEVFGEEVNLLHGAGGIARQIARLVEGQTFDRTAGRRAVMTGDPDDFRQLTKVLKVYGIDHIEQF